jgi:hypothetical protein
LKKVFIIHKFEEKEESELNDLKKKLKKKTEELKDLELKKNEEKTEELKDLELKKNEEKVEELKELKRKMAFSMKDNGVDFKTILSVTGIDLSYLKEQ